VILAVALLFSGLLTLGLNGRSTIHPGADSFLEVSKVDNTRALRGFAA
jgi:hypothetical protein